MEYNERCLFSVSLLGSNFLCSYVLYSSKSQSRNCDYVMTMTFNIQVVLEVEQGKFDSQNKESFRVKYLVT